MEISKKLEEAYVKRMPPELKEKFVALSASERTAIIKALLRFHQVMEEEIFWFKLWKKNNLDLIFNVSADTLWLLQNSR